MGSLTYDFLANSFLFSDDLISDEFKEYSDDKINQELEKYRNHCLKNFDNLKLEISNNTSSIKVFSSIDDISLSFLTQTALYIEQFIISDPLFKLTEKYGEHSDVVSNYLGFKKLDLDRKKMSETLKFLKTITPFIANNYVKILPYNIFFESPKELPFRMPENYDNDILPESILSYFRKKAIVSPMHKLNGLGWAFTDEDLKPTRAINIRYDDFDINQGLIYFLFESEILKFDEKTGEAEFRQYLPDTPPDIDYFNAWVAQSINQSAKKIFDKIYLENAIAVSLNSTILCNDSFTSSLLNQTFNRNATIQTFTANELINLDLPFIKNIDLNKLMEIRNFEEDVFTNFRIELERNFREIRSLTDLNDIKLKRENIIHELNEVQVSKINSKFTHIKKQIGVNSVVLFGSLLASSVTNGFSLLSLIHTLVKGYQTYNDYIKDVKMNPSYMLWKIKQK